jgi:non-ribosomal peptide synthetase-like protein
MCLYLRALGARIGKDVVISEFEAGAIDLLTIGDYASTGGKARFANVTVVGNEVIVGPVEIGRGSTIGNGCALGPNTRLEEGAELADLTAIQEGMIVPAFERWDGSPARKVGTAPSFAELSPPSASPARRAVQLAVYAGGYVVVVMLGLVPIFPAFYVLYNLDSLWTGESNLEVAWSNLPFLAWPTAVALIVVSMAIVVALRWVILPKVKPGIYSIHSWFYVRKWLLGLVIEVTLETLNSLFATIYMRNWYRLMGCKIGKGSEISTNLAGRYDLVEIGENNFVGDEASLGDEEVERGWMTLKRVKTGNRVFLGNDSIIAQGAVLADDTLVGVKSKLPDSLTTPPQSIWFGSPAIEFPTRQRVQALAGQTYQPPKSYLLLRAVFETIHTAIPTALFIVCGYITADLISVPLEDGDWLPALGIFLAAGLVIAALLVLVAAAVKWVVMGVYKPTVQPMWSWWAMRTEAVAVLYGGLVGKASLEFLRGTPFLPWALRLFGTRIGKGVWMDCTDVTEFDCITIGDFSVLNDFAVLQTHLYEDRVMKVGRIRVGRGVSIGAASTVLYDTEIGDFARINPLTVVMKGDRLPGHSEWEGAPSVPASGIGEGTPRPLAPPRISGIPRVAQAVS